MAYTVTTTAGTALATIADGTVNTTATSLTLIGKNYAGYGIFLNENYVQLLENFSNTTPPSAPITGQLWYDNVNDILKVYNADTNIWKPISSSISQATAPSSNTSVTGDIWWDTTNAQLKVWSGSAWITVGPSYTSTAGTSGAVVESILDNTTQSRVVVKFYISSSVIAILSSAQEFTPQTSISGFSSIKPGLNLISSATLTNSQFTGTVENASRLNSLESTSFLRSDTPTTASGALTAAGGLTVGSDLIFDSSSGTVASIGVPGTSNKNIQFNINKDGSPATALTITALTNTTTLGTVGTPGNLSVTGTASVTGVLTTGTVLPSANASINIGSASARYANVYAQFFVGAAVTSQYADLAERFEADAVYSAGTVVALGGLKEITAAAEELTEDVFGVISTRAGFLMNGDAGSNETHPAIAVNGRVPVRVIGQVKKGDRLVSAGRGLARAASREEVTAFNVIGRSLQDKSSLTEGTVEAIVKINS